jgi:hypothetical protein
MENQPDCDEYVVIIQKDNELLVETINGEIDLTRFMKDEAIALTNFEIITKKELERRLQEYM